MKKLLLLLALVGVCLGRVSAQGVPLDTFDTYSDSAAFEAAWTQDTANTLLMTDGGFSGNNYIRTQKAPVTPTGRISKSINLTASDTSPITISLRTRVETTAQGRSYIQLEAPDTNLINFGSFNSPSATTWMARTLGGGAPGTWSGIGTTNRVAGTWVHLKVIVKARDVEYYVDDVLQATQSRTSSDWPTFTQFRLGFSVSTSVINVDYDDVSVTQDAAVNDWNLY